MRMLKSILFMITLILVLGGCARGQVEYIGQRRPYVPFYNRVEPPQVDLFVGTVEREYEPIAWVDSTAVLKQTPEAAKEQLEELQELASRVGADAVHEIETKKIRAKNYVLDRRVPFTAWKQGYYDMKFMRGMAIRYKETNEDSLTMKPIEVIRRPMDTVERSYYDDNFMPPQTGAPMGPGF